MARNLVQANETTDNVRLVSSSSKLPVLDGLRSWVLLIMLAHFGNFDNPAPGDWIQRGWLLVAQVAFVGLDVFFVLSGFLITRILIDTKRSPSYFRTFYARRAIRILPVYYGFLLMFFFVLPRVVSWQASEVSVTPLQQLFYWIYLQNWTVLGLWDPTQSPLLLAVFHFWSLAVEEQFYLVWPLVVFMCSTRALRNVCLGCLIASPIIRVALVTILNVSPAIATVLTPARLDGLALGALMAIVAREPGGLAPFIRWAKLVAPLAFLVLMAVLGPQNEHDTDTIAFHVVALTASVYLAGSIVALSLALKTDSLWYRALDSWPLRTIGGYSYTIYAVHFPLFYVLGRSRLLERSWFHGWIDSYVGAELAFCATLMVLSIGVGALSWRFFEGPFLRLRKYLPYARHPAAGTIHESTP